MINPHYLAAIETLVRAWLEAGHSETAAAAAERVARIAREEDATMLMRASRRPRWLPGSDGATRRAAIAAAGRQAPWWSGPRVAPPGIPGWPRLRRSSGFATAELRSPWRRPARMRGAR